MKPQMSQMMQMGADPTGMGPPKAASGLAGGQWGRRGGALMKARPRRPHWSPCLRSDPTGINLRPNPVNPDLNPVNPVPAFSLGIRKRRQVDQGGGPVHEGVDAVGQNEAEAHGFDGLAEAMHILAPQEGRFVGIR